MMSKTIKELANKDELRVMMAALYMARAMYDSALMATAEYTGLFPENVDDFVLEGELAVAVAEHEDWDGMVEKFLECFGDEVVCRTAGMAKAAEATP